MSKSFTSRLISRSITGRLPVVRQGLNLLVVLSLLFSALGISATPAGAAGPENNRPPGQQAALPGFAQPEVHKTVRPKGPGSQPAQGSGNLISCGTITGVDGCDGNYRTELYLHFSGPAGFTVYENNGGGFPIYATISANYHTILAGGRPDWPDYLANTFSWGMYNVLVGGVGGADVPRTGSGYYTYQGAGSINPSWWAAVGFGISLDGLWPYDTRVVDSVDIHFSTSPIAGVPLSGIASAEACSSASTHPLTQGQVADPINTHTGGFSFPVDDLSIPTSAGALTFQRMYISEATERFTAPLGPGWTDNQDLRLVFPDDPAGQPGYVLFKCASGNMHRFKDHGDGTYSPFSGILASLTRSRSPYVYTVTDSAKNVYTFDADGRVQTKADIQGRTITYTYEDGLLSRVSADDDTRYIDFDYEDGRLASITDQSERSVSYGYDDPAGDLVDVTDVLGHTWHYVYEEHLLTEAQDPDEATIVRNEYLAPVVESVNFDDHTLSAYDGSSGTNTTTVEDDGATLHIVGDGRKKIDFPYTTGNQTVIEFDYKSTVEGDVQAIGFDEDDTLDWARTFKLYGTEAHGLTDYNNYAGDAPDWKHYKIRLGDYPIRSNTQYLYFINDDSAGSPTAVSYFKNIKVYEETTFGKVANQYDGNDTLVAGLTYNEDGSTIITDALGNSKTHTYDLATGVLLNDTDMLGGSMGRPMTATSVQRPSRMRPAMPRTWPGARTAQT